MASKNSVVHDNLRDKARAAISAVHTDTSVPLATTFSSLQDLLDHTSQLIEAVQADIDDEE
jgi:hypothetical protein